jgi:hypothetical protein
MNQGASPWRWLAIKYAIAMPGDCDSLKTIRSEGKGVFARRLSAACIAPGNAN